MYLTKTRLCEIFSKRLGSSDSFASLGDRQPSKMIKSYNQQGFQLIIKTCNEFLDKLHTTWLPTIARDTYGNRAWGMAHGESMPNAQCPMPNALCPMTSCPGSQSIAYNLNFSRMTIALPRTPPPTDNKRQPQPQSFLAS